MCATETVAQRRAPHARDPLLGALRDEVRDLARRVVALETRLDALQAIAVMAGQRRVGVPGLEERLARRRERQSRVGRKAPNGQS
jgi:hypothetical protein